MAAGHLLRCNFNQPGWGAHVFHSQAIAAAEEAGEEVTEEFRHAVWRYRVLGLALGGESLGEPCGSSSMDGVALSIGAPCWLHVLQLLQCSTS